MAKRRRLNQNRFQKESEQRFFSLDATRRNLLKWGVIAGGLGGLFMIQQAIIWQIVGVLIVVLVSNYHINRAAQRIPRWHAVITSFAAVIVSMFSVIFIGTIILNLQSPT